MPELSPVSPQNLRIALLDDDDLYRQYVTGLLAGHAGLSVRQCANGAALLVLLETDSIDCILVDQDLGAESGLETAGQIQRKYPSPPPLIMLTGDGDERLVAKAFRAGFSDYVSKRNLQSAELLSSIRQAVERNLKLKTQKEAQDRLDRLSAFDPITGLFARHYILESLNERLASATRRAGGQALILARLGKLNGIRDQFGHAVGDRALRAFAIRLQKAARRDDLVGRYGSDSFLYLVDGEPGAGIVAAICGQLVEELNFEASFDRLRLRLTSTLAVAAYPADGSSAEALLQMAERRLGAAGAFDPHPEPLPEPGISQELPSRQAAVSSPYSRVADLRGERRQRVLKRGQIVLPERRAVIDCTIRDVSSKGARLSVEHYFAPLDEFDLRFLATGTNRPAKTRWQIGGNVGVEFIAA